jgi:ABC-type sugar transport system permease subunit
MEKAITYRAVEKSQFRHFTDREEILSVLFLLPAVVYIIALVGIPFILAIAFSLTDVGEFQAHSQNPPISTLPG